MLYLDRIVAACLRRELFYYTPGGERGGIWFFYLSPYSLTCHTTGLGRQKSLAQSIFQVGGNGGSAVGPLLAAIIILPFGQHAISWFALAALLAAIIMIRLGTWYRTKLSYVVTHQSAQPLINHDISRRTKYGALLILILLIFRSISTRLASRATSRFLDRQVRRFGTNIAALFVRVPIGLCYRNRGRGHVGR